MVSNFRSFSVSGVLCFWSLGVNRKLSLNFRKNTSQSMGLDQRLCRTSSSSLLILYLSLSFKTWEQRWLWTNDRKIKGRTGFLVTHVLFLPLISLSHTVLLYSPEKIDTCSKRENLLLYRREGDLIERQQGNDCYQGWEEMRGKFEMWCDSWFPPPTQVHCFVRSARVMNTVQNLHTRCIDVTLVQLMVRWVKL